MPFRAVKGAEVERDRAGHWAAFEVKLGDGELDGSAASLLRVAGRVERPPSALAVVTTSGYAYRCDDGVYVIPMGCIGP